MEFKGWNSFEDLAKACGYTNCHKDTNNTSEKNNTNSTNNSDNAGCYDIPSGFQSLNPELFIIIGEILGNIISGSLPFNVQNAIGNWLQLVGQAIETYNAQQQYFQGGPGTFYNPKYYNSANPFCTTTSTSNTKNTSSWNNNNSDPNNEKRANYDSNTNSSIENNFDKIKELELRINQLTSEIEQIKNKIEK
ncbi:hypothetical protein CDLVIII_4185 [Clostridium sp. DL-VIII]|uniref:hypothetical protein n=1 Tax=Clostridium sp. DL-VIII TaxID=641107 RepID=UPI00023AFB69|nr:hypothetical protein [Clostridium sp. DL-VIII]EHJ00712.1 hypothetical protein CDLVIII_4185 [Clostridium sp. DL-VIII]